jgi:hypothetical protein
VNLKKASSILVAYKTINLYLDHDEAGRKVTKTILLQYPNAVDKSSLYQSYKDLNEYHLAKVKACLQGKMVNKAEHLKKDNQ